MNTISAHYGEDHDRLDSLFGQFQRLKTSDFARARALFSEFQAGLELHIRWEEEILFPQFEGKTGLADQGPTVVMRLEHRQIKESLARITEKLVAGKIETDEDEADLLKVLRQHNLKEETVLYPIINDCLSEDELVGVFHAMGDSSVLEALACSETAKTAGH